MRPCTLIALLFISQPPTWTPRAGDAAEVYAPETGVTFAAADPFAYIELMKIAAAEDRVGLHELESRRRAFRVSHGTPCLVLEYSTNPFLTANVPAACVRFQGGSSEGQKGWLIGNRIRPRGRR